MISKKHFSYRKLFNLLKQNNYTLSNFRINHLEGEYPEGYLMHHTLYKKTKSYNNILECSWEVNTQFNQSCRLLIYNKGEIELSEKQIKTLIDIISFVLSFNNKSDDLVVHFVPLKDKKLIHKNQYHLTNKNINSGGYKLNEICIYRYEECLKVLIHECIHHLHFSNQSFFSEDLTNYYIDKYQLNVHKINMNEAYTEILARLFYCFYLSEKSYQKFLSYLLSECSFSMYQANKLLLLNEKSNINEKTNTVAYYIITAELFHNLHHFLNYCFKNTNGFYLSNKSTFNQMIFSLQKIKKRRITKNQKNYLIMKMTNHNHKFFP